jgi:hypothetical protein
MVMLPDFPLQFKMSLIHDILNLEIQSIGKTTSSRKKNPNEPVYFKSLPNNRGQRTEVGGQKTED